MSSTAGFAAFGATLRILGAAPRLYSQVQKWRGLPNKADRERITQYCRRLDERRVFSAPFNVEVVEVCLGSLDQVKDWTDKVLAEMEHPAAQATVGAILDEVRRFLDKWHGHRTPRALVHDDRWPPLLEDRPHLPNHDQDRAQDFFQDLGELRGKMKVFVRMLIDLAPGAKAPKLLGA